MLLSSHAQSLDPLHPIAFEGNRIVYDGKLIRLDKHHLYLNSDLEESPSYPYAFKNFQKAVAHLGDSCTLYIAPGVYWVDNPDSPKVVRGENGREPFGCVIRAKNIHFIGLNPNPTHIVMASQRGQTQGAIGNFTMFDIWCDSLRVENLTMGNYCNVDLDYPLKPQLSKPKRSEAITQAHVGYVHGKTMSAKNVRFISRLNLNPLNGAMKSYYEDCHFECTDDAMNGTAVYHHCSIDLYGQKPFWSTFGRGAMFIDCDFYVKSDNREMYFCKQGGPLTLIDCRYHAPSDSIYIGWTAYPQKWLRCYQQNFTLNGTPYYIGNRQPENTVRLSHLSHDSIPFLPVSKHKATLLTGQDTLCLYAPTPHWRIEKGYEQYITLLPKKGDSIVVIPTNNTDETARFCIETYTPEGYVAACELEVISSLLPAPQFVRQPVISVSKGIARLDYELDLGGRRDESDITWYALKDTLRIPIADSHDQPVRQVELQRGLTGYSLQADIRPKHQRSLHGNTISVSTGTTLTAEELSQTYAIHTDFHDFPCEWQPYILPGFWTVDGYKPSDTADYPWDFDSTRPMWKYDEGFNGAVGKGLLQEQRGARLMYTPVEGTYGDMQLTLLVDPTKTAGQGFGSATGQYMDVCLKFDTKTLTGYGLRIIRTTKYAKAVDFLLVKYENGTISPLTNPVSSTCYRTGCSIVLTVKGSLLTAHVETTTPKPSEPDLPHTVDLTATIQPNPFGGIAIQHTGSSGGESTTMLHQLNAEWNNQYKH